MCCEQNLPASVVLIDTYFGSLPHKFICLSEMQQAKIHFEELKKLNRQMTKMATQVLFRFLTENGATEHTEFILHYSF